MDEVPSSLSNASGFVRIAGREVRALFDSCSSESFIHPRLVDSRKRKVWSSSKTLSMTASAFSTGIKGHACMYQGQESTHVWRKYVWRNELGTNKQICLSIR